MGDGRAIPTITAERIATRAACASWATGRMAICRFAEAGRVRGDFVLNAHFADRAQINLMLVHARGLPCLVLAAPLYDRLELRSFAPPPGRRNPRAPAYAATIEAAAGVTTGISAADRAATIAGAIAPNAGPADVRQPGHVPVLRADPEARGGATPIQTVLALGQATGLLQAGVVCEVLDRRGDLADAEQLAVLATALGMPIIDLTGR